MQDLLLPILFAYAFLTSFVLTAAHRNESDGRPHGPALIRGAQLAFGLSVGAAVLLFAAALAALVGTQAPPL